MDLTPKSRFEALLRRFLSHKEIGWHDIGEVFFRYQILKTPWFNIYLHQLDAPNWHPKGCHDHPWWFITLLLKGGYLEKRKTDVKVVQGPVLLADLSYTTSKRRYPGQILYRAATFAHDVVTPHGRSWSLILTGKKSRDWGHSACEA